MTPDWHLPVAAILDYFKLTEIALLGFSLGGCLVIRAAAREPRISRVIAMDICTSLFEASTKGFSASGLSVIAANSEQMPASLVNAAVAAVRKTDLLTDWSIAQGQRVWPRPPRRTCSRPGATTAPTISRLWSPRMSC
jgi:pimeloyl-ACP methyl ester carboxylesterase